MLAMYHQLATLLKGTIPVLVTGETGVGKEHVVRILHSSSDRAQGPLQIVNCTAIPADLLEAELFGIEAGVATGVTRRTGKLRLAHGGILFLDEIGDMDPALQAKLLRALQEGEVHPLGAAAPITVNVRVIAATNTNLEQRVRDGHFRKDLYYRIAGCEVHVPAASPPPRRHPVARSLFPRTRGQRKPEDDSGTLCGALETLQQAAWPGNVRQLQRELTRLVVSCPAAHTIESNMISPAILTDGIADDAEAGQQTILISNSNSRSLNDASSNGHSSAPRGITRKQHAFSA